MVALLCQRHRQSFQNLHCRHRTCCSKSIYSKKFAASKSTASAREDILFWLAQEQARANVLLCKVLRIIHRTIKIQMSTQDCSHNNVWDIRRRLQLSFQALMNSRSLRQGGVVSPDLSSLHNQIQAPPELGSGATAGVWKLYPWASGCSKKLFNHMSCAIVFSAPPLEQALPNWALAIEPAKSNKWYVIYYIIRIYWFTCHLQKQFSWNQPEPSSLFWKLEGPAWASSLPAARIHYCAGKVWRSYSHWHNK